jgi:hypothetical protein
LPGAWLEAIARAVFDEPALSHAALPTIADFQLEWSDAGGDRRRRWLARWRGYVAFWSLMVMAPIVFRAAAPAVSRPAWLRTRRLGLVVIALLIVGATQNEVVRTWLYLLYRDLGGAWRAVGSMTPVAFLAGPLAIALLLLRRRTGGAWDAPVAFSGLMFFSLLSVTVAGLSSAASVVGLRSGGHAVLAAVSDAALAMRNGLLMALVCLLFAGGTAGREWWRGRTSAPFPPEMSRGRALGWSGLLIATLFGVDQLLRAHHGAMRALILMADPGFARRSGSLQVLVQDTFQHSLLLLLAGGFALTSVVVVAGVKGWRAGRARGPHPLFTWVSRAALIVAVAGAAYHARVVVTDLASFHEIIDRLIDHRRANPPRPAR